MAKEQSQGLDIRFRRADVCSLNPKTLGKFDLVIDGLCLHCITKANDRQAFLENVCRLLKNDGLFILMTMCAPIDRKQFRSEYPDFRLLQKVLYILREDTIYEGSRRIGGRVYMPHRYIAYWKNLLNDLRRAGLEPRLFRYHAHHFKDTFGTLTVGAVKKEVFSR